jgi:hypothetical protein
VVSARTSAPLREVCVAVADKGPNVIATAIAKKSDPIVAPDRRLGRQPPTAAAVRRMASLARVTTRRLPKNTPRVNLDNSPTRRITVSLFVVQMRGRWPRRGLRSRLCSGMLAQAERKDKRSDGRQVACPHTRVAATV